MKILSIELLNFRGIESTSIELADGAPGQVVSLIGLNESGKTTIIEAISRFVSLDPATQDLVESISDRDEPKTFIPKHRRGRFSDTITIKARLIVEKSDISELSSALKKKNIRFINDGRLPVINVRKVFRFKDSKLESITNTWGLWDYAYSKGKGSKEYKQNILVADPVWHEVVKILLKRLPKIVYFPTFLFDFPARVYLTELPEESPINLYYRLTLGNVLKSIDTKYRIQDHILDRVSQLIDTHGFDELSNSYETAEIDAVVKDMANEISRVIMGAWKLILGGKTSNQRIDLKWKVDQAKDNAVFIEMALISGDRPYLLRERSLGFRWFFSFLFFTQFRRLDESNLGTIFLFDEPATNLHSAAQLSLLDSFKKIMTDKDFIIYSTHSHYMINPLWLEKAYIVENSAIDFDNSMNSFEDPKPNNIKAIPYKQFVKDNPSRTTYFQPVLDALHYRLSPLDLQGPAIILEGKFDYYPFRYLKKHNHKDDGIKCYSANGAGEMGVLISIFRASDIPFVILLDADKQGLDEKRRYIRDYALRSFNVLTLADIDSNFNGLSFESLYQSDVKKLIVDYKLDGGGKLKAQGSALFQLLSAMDDMSVSIDKTLKVFDKIYSHLTAQIALQ